MTVLALLVVWLEPDRDVQEREQEQREEPDMTQIGSYLKNVSYNRFSVKASSYVFRY
jgi:hypothetical protein